MDTRELLSEPTPIRIRSTKHASKYFPILPNLSHMTPLRSFVITVTADVRDARPVVTRGGSGRNVGERFERRGPGMDSSSRAESGV